MKLIMIYSKADYRNHIFFWYNFIVGGEDAHLSSKQLFLHIVPCL